MVSNWLALCGGYTLCSVFGCIALWRYYYVRHLPQTEKGFDEAGFAIGVIFTLAAVGVVVFAVIKFVRNEKFEEAWLLLYLPLLPMLTNAIVSYFHYFAEWKKLTGNMEPDWQSEEQRRGCMTGDPDNVVAPPRRRRR